MSLRRIGSTSLVLALSLVNVACGGGGGSGGGTDGGTAGTDAGVTSADAGAMSATCDPQAVPCTDQQILELSLYRTVAPGTVETTGDATTGFSSVIDATAGGSSPTQSYVYARFTDTGLEKVAIDDESALEGTDWDIAFRRFIIRLNSGVSGPSCVAGARTARSTDYDTLTAAPAGLAYRTEEYFTASCDLVPDGSGLGSPGTALQSFWEYPGCVKMTGNVYVIRLGDGRHVKLIVDRYYSESAQAMCQSSGSVPMTGSGSGHIAIRWNFISAAD